MKIVTTSKFYFNKSATEDYLLQITDLLRSHQNEIAPFSFQNKENLPSSYEKFFASPSTNNLLSDSLLRNKLIFGNSESKKKLSALIESFAPDVIWNFGINNELMPHIINESKKNKLKIIQTVSDDSLIKEVKSHFYGIRLSKKTTDILSASINKSLKFYSNQIDTFIAPSQFLIKKMLEEGMPKEKIVHIPSFIDHKKYSPNYDSEKYYVYSGRLAPQKGILELIKAAKNIPEYNLFIIGEGPLEKEIRNTIIKYDLDNVCIISRFDFATKEKLMQNARFCINPTQWHENSPSTILEGYAYGKAVIASNLGGIPEYITDNYSGLLFQYDNQEELESKIHYLMKNPKLSKEMGAFSRSLVENCYNSDIHYHKISTLLKSATTQSDGLSPVFTPHSLNIS